MTQIEHAPRISVRIEEVARCAGVSAATVSRVLNNRGKCSAETRERVLGVIHDLGYRPNQSPRALAQGKIGAIGLLVPNFDTEFAYTFFRAATDACAAAGYNILLAIRQEGAGRRMLGRYNTDGVIVFPNYLTEPDLKLLLAERCPAVLMYQTPGPGVPLPGVTIENIAGAHAVVSHLIKVHGRRRIAFMRGPYGNEDSLMREAAYRQALLEHGIDIDPRLIRNGGSASVAHGSTLELVREQTPVDAIFSWSDDAAAGVLSALRASGKSVPGDISVVGFDDVPSAQRFDPPLTTVRAPTADAATQAVQQLVSLIENGTPLPKVRLPTELVIRRSCGCGAS